MDIFKSVKFGLIGGVIVVALGCLLAACGDDDELPLGGSRSSPDAGQQDTPDGTESPDPVDGDTVDGSEVSDGNNSSGDCDAGVDDPSDGGSNDDAGSGGNDAGEDPEPVDEKLVQCLERCEDKAVFCVERVLTRGRNKEHRLEECARNQLLCEDECEQGE